MSGKIKKWAIVIGLLTVTTTGLAYLAKRKAGKTTYRAKKIKPISVRKKNFYERYIKRVFDVICATSALVIFSPLYLILAILVKFNLGSPVIFSQDRPGLVGPDGKETIFKMYKFRTMTDERDAEGNLLPDEKRLTKFGAWLRETSLDELPEAFNILNGTMSVIGPRPQLVKDLVFMSPEQRIRHTAKPGLSGLAQVKGRNAISWEDKFAWDLRYIQSVSFVTDLKICLDTVKKAFIKREGVTQENMATAEDFGDYLLRSKQIKQGQYEKKQSQARTILENKEKSYRKALIEDYRFSALMCVYGGDRAEWFQAAVSSILNQTLLPDEIVLVVDGPVSGNIEDIISNYGANPIFKILRLKENQGHGKARRIGIENCSYDLVALMDADDISMPNRFEKEIEAFKEEAELTCVGSNIVEFSTNPDEPLSMRRVLLTDVDIKRDLQVRCPMNQPSVMFNRQDIRSVGGYKDWFCNEDYYLWIRLAEKGFLFANIEEPLVRMRVNEDSYKRRGGWKYFCSEARLQKLMLNKKMIPFYRYVENMGKRFIVQVVLPNELRKFVFLKFARS